MGFPGESVVKNLPAIQEMWVWSLGREDPLEEEMATHSSILVWRIPWTERSLVGYSPWGQRVRDDRAIFTLSYSTPVAYIILRNVWTLVFGPYDTLQCHLPYFRGEQSEGFLINPDAQLIRAGGLPQISSWDIRLSFSRRHTSRWRQHDAGSRGCAPTLHGHSEPMWFYSLDQKRRRGCLNRVLSAAAMRP